jgi:tryptophan halogenase
MLPNNSAWATRIPYTDKEKEMEPYTNCTAINNGWVWNIPSWERIGTGYVFSDNHVSKEEALEEFKQHLKSDKMTVHNPDRDVESFEYKLIKFRVGIHERTFVKNVVAIGLSAGFIEPLESSGLFSVHEFLKELILYSYENFYRTFLLQSNYIDDIDETTSPLSIACFGNLTRK